MIEQTVCCLRCNENRKIAEVMAGKYYVLRVCGHVFPIWQVREAK